MNTQILTLSIYLFLLIISHAQSNDRTYLSNRYSIERLGTIGVGSNSVPSIPSANPEVIGNRFSKANFSKTNALLYNDQTISGLLAKYDVLNDEFYFQTKQGLRVMPGHQIKSFSFTDSLTNKISNFINTKEFKSSSEVIEPGFFEILYDGRMALFKKETASLQKANFNVTLNVGRQDHQINKKSSLFYLKDDIALKFPSKTLTAIFGNIKDKVDRFIKINQLNTKDERHLILIFEYANQVMFSKEK